MVRLAFYGNIQAGDSKGSRYNPHLLSFRVQNRSLLDMGFQIRFRVCQTVFLFPHIADSLKFLFISPPFRIFFRVDPFRFKLACHCAAGEHRRDEARPFFVCPVRQNQIAPGHFPALTDGYNGFQTRHNAKQSVISAAVRLCIHMGTDRCV